MPAYPNGFRSRLREKVAELLLEMKATCPRCQAHGGRLCLACEEELLDVLLLTKSELRERFNLPRE